VHTNCIVNYSIFKQEELAAAELRYKNTDHESDGTTQCN